MKKVLSLLVVFVLIFSLAACGSSNNGNTGTGNKSTNDAKGGETPEKKNELVVIKFPSFKTGTNVEAKFYEPQIERFNEKFAGQYRLELESIPQNDYGQKLKLLYQQKKLPPIIELNEDKTFTEEILIPNDALLDLKPYLDKETELSKIFIENSVNFSTRDGKIISLPKTYQETIGIFYNKEMFEKAGITKFPDTWNDFFVALDKLKASGQVPLSLMTGENAWTTILLSSAYMASKPEGEKILSDLIKVTDFSADIWVDTFAFTQRILQNYSSATALGAPYAVAANEFLSGNAAMIANGPWMVPDFTDLDKTSKGFADKVGASIYPEGIAIGSTVGYEYGIPKNVDPKMIPGIIEFFKFVNSPDELNAYLVTTGGYAPHVPMPASYEKQLHPILVELNQNTTEKMDKLVPRIHRVLNTQLIEEVSKNLPLLATGSMTPEEFAKALTERAQKFKK